jgi:DNA-binding response OmpR family regulator
MAAGFDEYWTKPLDLAEVHRRLDVLALACAAHDPEASAQPG